MFGRHYLTLIANKMSPLISRVSKIFLLLSLTIFSFTVQADTVYSTDKSKANVSGTAVSTIGVSAVTWSNSRGGSGTAVGTTNWSISDIPLSEGQNVITITATDQYGNKTSGTVTIDYQATSTTTTTTVTRGGGGGGGGSSSLTINNVSAGGTSLPLLTGPFYFGMTGDQVTYLQQYLAKDPTLYPAPVTGVYDATTTEAVTMFQVRNGLAISSSTQGLADATTTQKIMELLGQSTSTDQVAVLRANLITQLQAMIQALILELTTTIQNQLTGQSQ